MCGFVWFGAITHPWCTDRRRFAMEWFENFRAPVGQSWLERHMSKMLRVTAVVRSARRIKRF
jgi:hypothetical protein